VPVGRTDKPEMDVKGLQEGKEYHFRVKAINEEGESEPLETESTTLAKNPYGKIKNKLEGFFYHYLFIQIYLEHLELLSSRIGTLIELILNGNHPKTTVGLQLQVMWLKRRKNSEAHGKKFLLLP